MCELEVYHNVQVRKVLNVTGIYCILLSLPVLIKIKVFFSQLIRIQA